MLTDGLRQVAGTAVALIYGSVARGTEDAISDVDLLVIGDVEPAALDACCCMPSDSSSAT